MSCLKSEEAHDDIRNMGVCWYCWKDANIMVVGCRQHAGEVIDALNDHQKALRDKEKE